MYCLGGECNNKQICKFFYIDISDTRMNIGQQTAKCTEVITNRDLAPLQLDSHTAILYPESDNGSTDKMIVFGGYYKSLKSNKIFEYSFLENFWKELKPSDHEADDRIEEMKDGMNEYDIITDTMMETCTNLPRPRTNHTAVYYKNGMYVFGGSDEANNKLNDLWRYDLQKHRWEILNHISHDCDEGQPSKRSGHVASVIGDKMYIFGGLEGITHETNDFYYYEFETDKWTIIQLKVSNPEDIKPSGDNKESLQINTMDRKKSLTKSPNMSWLENRYNKVNSPMSKHHPSASQRKKDKSRNNRFFGTMTDREKFSKTFYNSPLRNLLTQIVIPKKVKDEEVEVNSPTTLALKSSVFLKANDGFDQAAKHQNKKKNQIHMNADIKKTSRIPMMIPCPRDGACMSACNNKLIVFGGDRYQMAFNDFFIWS